MSKKTGNLYTDLMSAPLLVVESKLQSRMIRFPDGTIRDALDLAKATKPESDRYLAVTNFLTLFCQYYLNEWQRVTHLPLMPVLPSLQQIEIFRRYRLKALRYERSHQVVDKKKQEQRGEITHRFLQFLFETIYADYLCGNYPNKIKVYYFEMWVQVIIFFNFKVEDIRPKLEKFKMTCMKQVDYNYIESISQSLLFRLSTTAADRRKMADIQKLEEKFAKIKVERESPASKIYLIEFAEFLVQCSSKYQYLPSQQQLDVLFANTQIGDISSFLEQLCENFQIQLKNKKLNFDDWLNIFNLWHKVTVFLKSPVRLVERVLHEFFSVRNEKSLVHYYGGCVLLLLGAQAEALDFFKHCDKDFLQRQQADLALTMFSAENRKKLQVIIMGNKVMLTKLTHSAAEGATEKKKIDADAKAKLVGEVLIKFEAFKKSSPLPLEKECNDYLAALKFCINKFSFIPDDEQLRYLARYYKKQLNNKLVKDILEILTALSPEIGKKIADFLKESSALFVKKPALQVHVDLKKAVQTEPVRKLLAPLNLSRIMITGTATDEPSDPKAPRVDARPATADAKLMVSDSKAMTIAAAAPTPTAAPLAALKRPASALIHCGLVRRLGVGAPPKDNSTHPAPGLTANP